MVRKKKTVRRHAVLNVPTLSKTGTSICLEISEHDKKIGEVEIGRGSLYRTGGKRMKSKRFRWRQLADLMDQLAYGE